ncbi:meiosis regulator and mRNA stability factor 1 [Phymastichus coffea]|uniref:meiosis regulator and mRNA stability factor 1 n=1 Tax=Phymastichus coffea TaxID=108790 RepID=UPI00273C1660|nr:meiosis regulator and mRNA stability factor 1 [Phymastichus coffea]
MKRSKQNSSGSSFDITELDENLIKLLVKLSPPSSCVQELMDDNEQAFGGCDTTLKTHERVATAILDPDNDDGDVDEFSSRSLHSYVKSHINDYTRPAYQEDPVIVAAAAAAAAVKFRSNYLPPIGVFWDIENCQVPKGRSAMAVTRVIRDKFFQGYKEAEFMVVCDVQKENKQIIQELNDAQVDLIHVSSTSKNAADEKLRQSIRRFADTHGSPAAIVLISGDIDFAADLSDLRHRKKIYVILLHKENTSEALILCSDEHYDFTKLLEPLPARTPSKMAESYDLLVYNLPEDKDVIGIKRRLKQLSNNCGGRVVQIRSNVAVLRFCSKESADRAQKRMHGKYIYDSKIVVKFLKENNTNCASKLQDNNIVQETTASDTEANNDNPNEMFGVASSMLGARSLPGTPHYPTTSPVSVNCSNWTGMHCGPQGLFPPPPPFARPYMPVDTCKSYSGYGRSQSPQVWQMMNSQQQGNRYRDERCKQAQECSNAEPGIFRSGKGPSAYMRGNSVFSQQADWNASRAPWPVPTNHRGTVFNQSHKRRSPSPMYAAQNQDTTHWNGQVRRNDRTPSPYDSASMPSGIQRISPYRHSDAESEEVENFFSPINNRNNCGSSNGAYVPIELQVSNLDQNIDPKDMKRILSSILMEHVKVLQVSVFVQSDGNLVANVKVPSLPEAQYTISQLHRRKIGFKRILISYLHSSGPNPQIVRSQIVMLLQEVPGHKLPLFKFREMYESRFMMSISISELYKMKDVCIITDDPSGRLVSLNPDHRNTPSPSLNTTLDAQSSMELPYCVLHAQKPWTDKGWAEQEMAPLPNVSISLKLLSERVHKLLITHSGCLPLPTFPSCYEAEFNESIQVDENGVPLEHLMSCISTVELKQGLGSVKHIVWSTNKNNDESNEENNSPLANQLALFSRESVDLLKTAPHCQLPFNRFIPAYHRHFGRQCRVADYGFTKLIELLEALTHSVQVMGEGNKRVVTLSHRAQVRRFTSDLLRILKSQASKQVTFSEFPKVYTRVFGKPWDVTDYGVCEIDDILKGVSETIVVVTSCKDGNDRMISIPKRERTPEEIERTMQFATEVVELLKHVPQQKMLFTKFVPSYHHHFGHQCRVSDYGFSKLIELFEAIPEVVKVEEENGGERVISLTKKEGLQVLGEQLNTLISRYGNSSTGQLNVSNIAQTFLQEYGYALRPEHFNCNSMLELMEKFEGTVKIVNTKSGVAIESIDKDHIQQLGLECRRVLMSAPDFSLTVNDFKQSYQKIFNKTCTIETYVHSLSAFIRIFSLNEQCFIELTPLQKFACNVQRVLMQSNGKMNISQFEGAYLKITGVACRAAMYGYPTVYALLRAIPCTVIVKDMRYKRKIVQLNKKLITAGLLPTTFTMSPSPVQDTDSSNESIENDSFLSKSSLSSSVNEKAELNNSHQMSSSKDSGTWENKSNHWTPNNSADAQKWPEAENKSTELNNVDKTSNTFPPPPLKPDSPDSVAPSSRTSIWDTPPQFYSKQRSNYVKVELPPMSLSPLKKYGHELVGVVSPSYLKYSYYNPLICWKTPIFVKDSNSSSVVAPHPSELPLPSMSFTPKKSATRQSSPVNNTMLSSPVSSKKGQLNVNDNSNRINDTTPSKRLYFGKCRLAAQFNQPSFDS